MLTDTKILFCTLTQLLEIVTLSNSYQLHNIISYHNRSLETKKRKLLLSAAFLFKKDIEGAENTCNLTRLGKSWDQSNFSQAHKIDLWNKMRVATEIGIRIFIKELEVVKVWIGVKLLMEINRKSHSSVVLLKVNEFMTWNLDFATLYPLPSNIGLMFRTELSLKKKSIYMKHLCLVPQK